MLSFCNFAGFKLGRLKAAEINPTTTSLPNELNYGTGTWDSLTLGNHRAVVQVAEASEAVRAHIPWRRRDSAPESKNILVVEAASGRTITNRVRAAVTPVFGDIVFQASAAGTYHVYYLAAFNKHPESARINYRKPEDNADQAWLTKNGLAEKEQLPASMAKLPSAQVVELQAIDEFNSFYPMEVVATDEELKQLVAANAGKPFLLFPEDRMRPIRMTDLLPLTWIKLGSKNDFSGNAAPGEYYSFQLGLYAAFSELKDIAIRFSELRSNSGGHSIPVSALRCFNAGGTNWIGNKFTKSVAVAKGKVSAIWCGIDLPQDIPTGTYEGTVTVEAAACPPQSVNLTVIVTGEPLPDRGDNEPARHSRLRWLDSTLAQDDEIVRPFTGVRRSRNTLSILGRQVNLGPYGLPSQILSHYSPEGTSIEKQGKPLLDSPMVFVAEDAGGKQLVWQKSSCTITKVTDGGADWTARSSAGPLRLELTGRLEFDGFVRCKATVSSVEPIELKEFGLRLPIVKAKARYFMGLGLQGQKCPDTFDWNWGVLKHQDCAWLGDTDAGMQFKLKAENYEPPLMTNHYADKRLNMPPSWYNEGRGGVSLRTVKDALLVNCFGGARKLEPGQALHFDFDLLLTPFKPLETREHWHTRFFHMYRPMEEVRQSGANTINIHHANEINPYINYPFLRVKEMRAYIDEAHQNNFKAKIYYTLRELSNHAVELFAFRALGDEICADGPGKGDAWLQEHLATNYIPAWYVQKRDDEAIVVRGSSRLDNYYIEGLAWLIKNVNIDGLYLDDLDYDRTTMKRVRKVLDRMKPGSLIDFHTANEFTEGHGYDSCASIYMEHFPYLNRLWLGEFYNPDLPPDFWLIEMSGIAFGAMSEMLQDGGNRWRGMLYGMTSRMPYGGRIAPAIWRVWDDFKIQDSQMYGYWSPRCPVKTDNKDILATAYVKPGKSLISVASWAAEDAQVRLSFDWKTLGFDPNAVVLTAPEVPDFQPAARFKPTDPIPVPKSKGWLLYIEPA